MIITVTLNPAMDKTVEVVDFKLGEVNRIISERYDIGGKGINVSKVLSNFGEPSICMGFLGGIWEHEFSRELRIRNINDEFIRINNNTRTNTKIVDCKNKVFTDVNAPGPFINNDEINKFIDRYKEVCKPNDIVVLSGGVPKGISTDIYSRLIRIAKENGARTILDADGELLREGLKENPDIIKPNAHELSGLMNVDENDIEGLIAAAVSIKNSGIGSILVSLGDKGAFYVAGDEVFLTEGLKVNVKSTVGAGDSMVAALVYSIQRNFSPCETLRFSNACGAVSVSLEGTTACTLEDVNNVLPKININKKGEL